MYYYIFRLHSMMDTNTWMIYHDMLPQWWERGAQDYIASRGFSDRQWRAQGTRNDDVAVHYCNCLMGDSPEMMPLDSSIFSDLIEKVAFLVVSTANRLGNGRYTMGTPDEAWRSMAAAWELVPEARIRQDVGRLWSAIELIIAAGGAYVPDLDLRNGHRLVMQRVVRGGALRGGDTVSKAVTEARIQAGVQAAVKTWEGISDKIRGLGQK